MAKKKDPSITFLNKFGYNVIRLPRTGIEPCPPGPRSVARVQHTCFSATMIG